MGIAAVSHDDEWLDVVYSDGVTGRFLGSWLRDNVSSGRHRVGGQRTFDINLLPIVTIAGASRVSDGVAVSFGSDGVTETFDELWLRSHSHAVSTKASQTLWGNERQPLLEFADFEQLCGDPARLREWLVEVRDLGFGLVENVPTNSASILGVVELFGFVRQTNYGQIFDVRVEPDPANLAFTSRTIGMHTDNPYRNPVPGLQLLHCLVNESDGGANQLCDGFAAADRIRRDNPQAFDLLTQCSVRFRYVENGSVDLESSAPLIELDARSELAGIRYNSRSAQPFDMGSDLLAEFYAAYRVLGEALHDSAALIEFRLDAGQLMVFDNHRVLHGRSSYDQGRRHLQGCYADKDSLRSRIQVLEAA